MAAAHCETNLVHPSRRAWGEGYPRGIQVGSYTPRWEVTPSPHATPLAACIHLHRGSCPAHTLRRCLIANHLNQAGRSYYNNTCDGRGGICTGSSLRLLEYFSRISFKSALRLPRAVVSRLGDGGLESMGCSSVCAGWASAKGKGGRNRCGSPEYQSEGPLTIKKKTSPSAVHPNCITSWVPKEVGWGPTDVSWNPMNLNLGPTAAAWVSTDPNLTYI